jgi:hypothetical protein
LSGDETIALTLIGPEILSSAPSLLMTYIPSDFSLIIEAVTYRLKGLPLFETM